MLHCLIYRNTAPFFSNYNCNFAFIVQHIRFRRMQDILQVTNQGSYRSHEYTRIGHISGTIFIFVISFRVVDPDTDHFIRVSNSRKELNIAKTVVNNVRGVICRWVTGAKKLAKGFALLMSHAQIVHSVFRYSAEACLPLCFEAQQPHFSSIWKTVGCVSLFSIFNSRLMT